MFKNKFWHTADVRNIKFKMKIIKLISRPGEYSSDLKLDFKTMILIKLEQILTFWFITGYNLIDLVMSTTLVIYKLQRVEARENIIVGALLD